MTNIIDQKYSMITVIKTIGKQYDIVKIEKGSGGSNA